jgi:hypothetical protein
VKGEVEASFERLRWGGSVLWEAGSGIINVCSLNGEMVRFIETSFKSIKQKDARPNIGF